MLLLSLHQVRRAGNVAVQAAAAIAAASAVVVVCAAAAAHEIYIIR